MAGPDDYIQLPEMNLGRLPRRRRRPRPPVVEMDEPEAGPALTTELRERDDVPNSPAARDSLSGIDDQLGRMRSQLGLTPPTPVVSGMEDEADSQRRIDDGLSSLRDTRGPLAVQRAQAIPLPGDEDSPESTQAILGAIETERNALPGIPRTQLRAPQVAPAPRNGPRGARYGMPVVAGMDDIEAEPMEENAAGLTRPQTGMVAGMDDFEEDFGPTQPKQASAPRIPGVQLDPNRDAAADDRDRTRMRRMNIAQGVISGGLGLAGIIGAARDTNQNASQYNMGSIMGTGGGLMSEGPRANIAARGERRQYEDAQAAAAEQSRLEQEDRAFRRTNEDRRAQLDERRIGQAEQATAEHARRTSAEFDVDSTSAQGLRASYEAMVNGLPEEAARILAPWVDLDIEGYNATAMQDVMKSLRDVIAAERQSNPRAFRQGQRTGARARNRGRLGGGGTGGGRGVNYGYGANAREGGAPIDPSSPEAMAAPEATAPAPRSRGGGGPARPRPPGSAQAPSAPTPGGRPLWDRPPTAEEAAANPALDYQESLIEQAARDQGLDLNDVRQRHRAAGFVDSMRENTEDSLASRTGQNRTPEQQRQVEQYVQHYGKVHGREVQLQTLGGAIHNALQQPNGALIVRAALHANSGIPSAIAAQSSEVTELRAMIFDHLNEYFHTYGGANVTDNEMMRYFSAFGAGSINADPREFLSAIRRARAREQAELTRGDIAFPDGSRLYFEAQGGR